MSEEELNRGLASLQAGEFLYETNLFPEREFTFKHALIQETAYQSLLRSVRQQFHARIARVLEEQFPERARAEPEVVAGAPAAAALGSAKSVGAGLAARLGAVGA